MPTLYVAPTANFKSTTLNGAINSSVGTITLTSTTNLQAPGAIIIDRIDSSGTVTPNAREFVTYTGISGNDLTGCTRGADQSTAQAHADAAIVETTPTVGMWNSLATIVASGLDSNGYLRALASPASIANIHTSKLFAAGVTVTSSINVASASVIGVGLFPTFQFVGTLSGATALLQTPLSLPKVGTFSWFSVMTRTQASTASVIIDINLNGTSIFAAGTRPAIAGGGTFVSTASIATKNFGAGNRLSWDFDNGFVTDLVIQGGTT